MKCEVPPVIPLQKLFDPLHLFISVLWQYSIANQVSLFDLEIELYPIKTPPTKAAMERGVYINGLQIKGGRISERTFLEEEYSREYQHKMMGFQMVVVKKDKTHMLQVFSVFFNYKI